MIALLDANVLVALVVTEHVHHDEAEDWLAGRSDGYATCPVTQGALVRFLLRGQATAAQAVDVLRGLRDDPAHAFWPDENGYDEIDLRGVIGHRQVTDAYLAGSARSRGGQLATFDQALATMHADVALLVGAGA